jgi:hypothetical protein
VLTLVECISVGMHSFTKHSEIPYSKAENPSRFITLNLKMFRRGEYLKEI